MIGSEDLETLTRTYARDGVVLVRGLLDDRQLDTLGKSLDFARANPGPMATDFSSTSDGEFFFDFLTFRRNSFVNELCNDPVLLQCLAAIVGTRQIRMFHDTVLIKSGDAPPSPWHQDRPHYLVEGENNFSVWMSPDDVNENDGLAFVPGSHRTGMVFRPRSFKDGEDIPDDGRFVPLTDELFANLASEGVRVFRYTAGDAIVFDNRTLHSAFRSPEPAHRRALSLRFVGDGARLTENFVSPSPALHRMGMKLVDGAAPPDTWFPLVFEGT